MVSCLNKVLPVANARPARAINLSRAFDLLRTDQFQFALFDKINIDLMQTASGPFKGKKPIDLRTILTFGKMQFVVRADFPSELVTTVIHNMIKCEKSFSIEINLNEIATQDPKLHPGAKKALEDYFSKN